jgi:hypothetical protein
MKPLGAYSPLLKSTSRRWAAGTVIHGDHVLDDLVAGLRHHLETDWKAIYGNRLEPQPAVIGCVPWLTDRHVVDALTAFGQCCIAVDKQQPEYYQVMRLATQGRPISSPYLEGFDELATADEEGDGPVIGPYGGLPEPTALGPIRVVGFKQPDRGRRPPMLHSKLLVVGVTTHHEDDEMFTGDILRFHPVATWMGSANWTEQARKHIEFGLWSDDQQLVDHNYRYLLSILRLSEPRGAATVGPEPDLVSANWDDEAFREYLAEHPDQFRDEEQDPDEYLG